MDRLEKDEVDITAAWNSAVLEFLQRVDGSKPTYGNLLSIVEELKATRDLKGLKTVGGDLKAMTRYFSRQHKKEFKEYLEFKGLE